MKWWVLAAGLLAAAVAPQALAADLDDGEPPPPGWKAPSWKDGGAYGYPPKGYSLPPQYYEDDDDDDDRGPPSKYSGLPPHKGPCVRSEQVRDRLTSLGWRDFHSGKAVSPTTVKLRARRPSGRLFELRLDRCSGIILSARPVELSPLRPYYGQKGPYRPYYDHGYGYRGPYGGGPYSYKTPPPDWDDDD